VRAESEDRFLYWPVFVAFGCPVVCVMIWSGIFFMPAVYPFLPPVIVSFHLAEGLCDIGLSQVCPVATTLPVAAFLIPAGLVYFLLAPLVILLWIGSGIVAPVIAVMACVEHGFRNVWRRVLSLLILPPISLAAAFNIGFLWHAGHTAADYVFFLANYRHYVAEIAELPAGTPRFKVWVWNGTSTPCGSGLAYDESDKAGDPSGTKAEPFGNWHIRSDVSGVAVSTAYRAFRHFYFVDICPAED
jgi:hypothetical protein